MDVAGLHIVSGFCHYDGFLFLQEGKKLSRNLEHWFLHFRKQWALCKVSYINTKKLLQMFILCRLTCNPFLVLLIEW